MTTAGCPCICHTGGAFRPPCDIPGGCGHLHETAPAATRARRCGLRCGHEITCGRCFRASLVDLRDHPELYVQASLQLAPSGSSKLGELRAPSPEHQLGIRPEAHDRMQELLAAALRWAFTIRQARELAGAPVRPMRRVGRFVASLPRFVPGQGMIPAELTRDRRPDRDPSAVRLVNAVQWLIPHHRWATEQSWGVDYAEEIRTEAHRTRQLCEMYDELPEHRAEVVCPECTLALLFRRPGDDRLYCENTGPSVRQSIAHEPGPCGAVLTPTDYRAWSRLYSANPTAAVRHRVAILQASAAVLDDVRGMGVAARRLRARVDQHLARDPRLHPKTAQSDETADENAQGDTPEAKASGS